MSNELKVKINGEVIDKMKGIDKTVNKQSSPVFLMGRSDPVYTVDKQPSISIMIVHELPMGTTPNYTHLNPMYAHSFEIEIQSGNRMYLIECSPYSSYIHVSTRRTVTSTIEWTIVIRSYQFNEREIPCDDATNTDYEHKLRRLDDDLVELTLIEVSMDGTRKNVKDETQ